jgi:hypothetical protein
MVHRGSHVGKRYGGNYVFHGTVKFEHSNYWFLELGDLCDTPSQVPRPLVYFTQTHAMQALVNIKHVHLSL